MFRHGLTWPQAYELMEGGAYVRRERWLDKRLFLTRGGLVWVDAEPPRVVQSWDFGAAERLARDWTDMGYDQGDCIDHPGWTHIEIHEAARWRAATPETRVANPPSWAPIYAGGREIGYGRQLGKRILEVVNGRTTWVTHQYWVHPFLKIPDPNGQKDWYGRLLMVPLLELVTWTVTPATPGTGDVLLSRVIPNPFASACRVEIAGAARDVLLLNGLAVTLPVSFVLMPAASFSIAARLRDGAVQPVAAMDLVIDLTLEGAPIPG